MKKIILAFVLLYSQYIIAQPKQTALPTLPIIPLPKELKQSEGAFPLSAETKLVLMNEAFKPEVDYLNSQLKTNQGFELQIVNSLPSDGNYLIILSPDKKTGSDEAYERSINPHQILLSAENNQGIFYGLQTLIQLLPIE